MWITTMPGEYFTEILILNVNTVIMFWVAIVFQPKECQLETKDWTRSKQQGEYWDGWAYAVLRIAWNKMHKVNRERA